VKESCSLVKEHSPSGYGSTGPYAKAPGYDVVIEAEAGLMHITGEKGGRPVKVSSTCLQVRDARFQIDVRWA